MKVLVAEDVEENFWVIQEFLKDYPVELVHVLNGGEALSELGNSPYDLVLMDIRMPGMDGLEAMDHIRTSGTPSISDLPVIAITAHAFEEQKKDYLGKGFTGVLSKPFTKTDLITALYAHTGEPGDISPGNNTYADLTIDSAEAEIEIPKSLEPLIDKVVDRLRTDLGKIANAFNNRDFIGLRELCHSVKGLTGMYGLNYIAQLMENLSEEIQQGDIKAARQLIWHSQLHLNELENLYVKNPEN
jgi:CheY-like chemotaxis protein